MLVFTPDLYLVNTAAEEVSTGRRQAAQDAQLLKSIVEPLEEQIGALKQKLRDTDLLLVESEKRQAKSTLGMSALTTWLSGQDSLDHALLALKEKQSELLTFSELKSKDQVWSLTTNSFLYKDTTHCY